MAGEEGMMDHPEERNLEENLAQARARIRQLEQQLAAAEANLDALLAEKVDAVVGDTDDGPLLLRQTQKALLESESKLRAIFEMALEAIAIIDDEGVYLDVNRAAAELYGIPAPEVVGKTIGDFSARREDARNAWQRIRDTGADRGLISLRRPDGRVRIAEYTAVANFVEGQNLIILRDVTERLEAELKREEVLTQLAERVKELTLLHRAGQILDRRSAPLPQMLQAIVDLIPGAWQYSDIAAASIRYGDIEVSTPQFAQTPWMQRASFAAPGGHEGVVEVCYLEEVPPTGEGPFLAEERVALDALTAMLQADLERRHSAEALLRSESRYRELFETMAQGVLYQDETGRVIDINPAARRILGLEDRQISTENITNNDLNLVREDGLPFSAEERPGRRALRSGKPVFGEVMGIYVPSEESYRWVVINSIPQFREGEARPYQVYSTLEDITERKRAEERRAQLAALVESSQDAILSVDLEGRIRSWNRGAEQTFGFSAEEIVGVHFGDLSPPELRHEQQEVMSKVRGGQTVENYSTIRLTKGGRRIFVNFSISPILDGTGKTVGVAGIARDVTAQKRAEARLRFQAQLLDSVNEAVVAYDLKERVVYWGKGAEKLYGFERGQAMGQTLEALNLLPLHMSQEAREVQLREVFENGYWRGVVQQRHDDTFFWARVSLSLVRDGKGRSVGFIGIYRDVTAQRQHERELEAIGAVADALRVAETPAEICAVTFDKLTTYLEVTGCAVGILEPDGEHYRLAFVSGNYAAFAGQAFPVEGDHTGDVLREGKPLVTDDLRGLYPELKALIPEGVKAACMPLIASNRTLGALWLGRASPFAPDELRLISAVADVLASALQRALFFERLEEQAAQVQRIMDTVEEGLVLLDPEMRVVLASPAAVEHLMALGVRGDGQESERLLVGQRVTKLGALPLQALLQDGPGTEQIVATEGEPRREFDVAAHGVVERGQESGWVLVLRDVTEARRTQEMVQQQERLAAVGQLAAGIAHDFNNVMSAIVLYAQILQRRDDLSEKERRRLDVIYRQANHAIELIKQILDFSRRSVMERSAMDLAPFFKEMFRLFDHTLPESISLSLQYDEAEYFVMADPTRLQQAITNLAINARDAMPEGGAFVVHLSRKQLQVAEPPPAPGMKPGQWLEIAVTDSGAGMSPEMLQHVFEPFYTTKGPGKGTGLGLAQVHGIIAQHDGFITVESALGKGTTFTIYLPLLEEDRLAHDQPVPDFAAAAVAEQEATVLVVEDEEWARIAVEETLQALGYRVLTASDGNQALAAFEERGDEIDLVLSDMVMPEMGGLKLFEHIRSHYPQVKLVIMSGYPLENEERSLLEQGVVAWISKPFSVNELAEKVAAALQEDE